MAAIAVVLLLLAASAASARADLASVRAECTEQLVGLMPCLAFVQGEARMPTPDCCVDAKTVVQKSFRCLCWLVKYRDEPELGLKINVSRAVTLPGVCNVPANISDCPKLLKLSPGSPEAQEFYKLENEIASNAQAKSKSSDSVGAKGTTTSRPSCSTMAQRSFIVQTCAVLQLCLFLFSFF